MKYLKTLALLISLSTLASCDQGFEDFSADTYSMENIEDANGTKSNEPNDSTPSSPIKVIIDDATDIEDIDCVINI